MKNLSVLKPNFRFFFFLLFHCVANAISKPPYTPTDIILVNCGSSNETSGNGRQWNGDLDSSFGPIESSYNKSIPSKVLSRDSPIDLVPYMTARISRYQFMYSFPVTPGHKFIRLYFHPSSYDQGFYKYKDFFDVTAGYFTLLRNFSASLYADAQQDEVFVREFCVNVDENQLLNLTFSPFLGDSSGSFVFINGIEIVSMPTNLYFTSPDTPGLTFTGIDKQFYVQNDTALETVCRLNVGGSFISAIHDTGMYRSWDNDSDYFYTNYGDYLGANMSLNYSKIPPYTAPDDVYQSARSMGSNRANNLLNNITWKVPVDQGFRYLVRLHFCEIVPQMTMANDRRFSIFIDNEAAEVDFDIFESSGGSGIPMYKEYVVMVGTEGETDYYMLLITLLPNASTAYADAILNGLEVLKLSDSSRNLARPVREGTNQQSPTAINKSNDRKILLIVVGVGIMCLLISVSLLACIFVRPGIQRKRNGSYYGSLVCCQWLCLCKGKKAQRKASSHSGGPCRYFSLDEIKAATNNFHEDLIIGVGGFGNVYKGDIDDGAMVVAVKRLNPESRQGAHEFKTEIETLSPLQHAHLVSLIGYCDDEGEMILVYDYIINGTLREHLYETNKDPLTWIQRLEICVGAASGLHYLHAGMAHPIIHRDVKTTNILLDENWVAKVSDFGLSKMGMNNNAVSTMVKGTWGYLDPEYARLQKLTEKSDVYSFGVVLFEVLCARRPLNQKLEEEQWNLAYWARKCIKNGTIHQIIDPYLKGRIAPKCFKIFAELAESCVCDNGIERPTMHDVMERLKFALEVQKATDAEMVIIVNPGNEYVYPEISFHSPRFINIGGHFELDSTASSGGLTTLDTNSTRTSFPSVQSDSITSCLL